MTSDRIKLWAEWGQPQSFDRGTAFTLCRLDPEGREQDFFAFLYPSREAAEAFAAANRDHHGHDTHGPIQIEGGWVGVVDLCKTVDGLKEKATANGL